MEGVLANISARADDCAPERKRLKLGTAWTRWLVTFSSPGDPADESERVASDEWQIE